MKDNKIQIGISSACFFPKETIESVRTLAEWKIPNIEIFFNSPRELKENYLNKLAEICKGAGVNVVSIHPFTSGSEPLFFFTDYPGRFEDGVEIYRHYFRAAQYLGAKYVVFHGDSLFSRISQKKAFEQIKQMDLLAREEYGVCLAYENVVRCRGREPDYFLALKEFYPQIKFVLDTKQALRSNKKPEEYLQKLGNSIVHIHISDSNESFDCLPMGKGKMDIKNFLNQLKKVNFEGCILQELYQESYEHEREIREGYHYLEQMLREG